MPSGEPNRTYRKGTKKIRREGKEKKEKKKAKENKKSSSPKITKTKSIMRESISLKKRGYVHDLPFCLYPSRYT
jgi:hypothetical protein